MSDPPRNPAIARNSLAWLAAVAAKYLLPVWFGVWAVHVIGVILTSGGIGGDALIYYRAATAWVHGGNPWEAQIPSVDGSTSFHFYALPPTVVLLAPFTLLPESWIALVSITIQAVSAIYIVRRLALHWSWLIFPPLVSGVLSGNPSIVLLAALLGSSAVANAVGPTLKAYAVLPLIGEGRWRPLLIASMFCAATAVLWPALWTQFLTGIANREARLMDESAGGFSAYQYGLLVTALVGTAILVLAYFDRRAAGWLAPIAVWPASQIHWSTFAMPLRSLFLAAMLAPHVQGLPVAAVLTYIAWRVLKSFRDHRTTDLVVSSADVNDVQKEPAVETGMGYQRQQYPGRSADHHPEAREAGGA
jgi:hypothetical protein